MTNITDKKRTILNAITASSLTTVIYNILISFLPMRMMSDLQDSLGYNTGWIIANVIFVVFMILSGFLTLCVLRYFNIKYSVLYILMATFIAAFLGFALIYFVVMIPSPVRLWEIFQFSCVILGFSVSNILYKKLLSVKNKTK